MPDKPEWEIYFDFYYFLKAFAFFTLIGLCLSPILMFIFYSGYFGEGFQIVISFIIVGVSLILPYVIQRRKYTKVTCEPYRLELKKYKEECIKAENEYKRKLEDFEQEIQEIRAFVNSGHYEKQSANIRTSIQEIQKTRNDISLALSHVYAYNVVYPKYRELVPVTMFCEYLASGRCDALEGHEGAYNIYENELRQNIIISKLDTIASKLDSIRSSQYLLYTAISDSNRISNQMVDSISAYSDQQARANALQELSNKAILDSNRALQDLGQKTLDEIKKFNA
ncbi:MAG: hypothetical protein E7634_05565 [Ruminococcaceae bacterium]|nr:hypothetical protein [Oscillospiraceae bacterium]